nr:MAG TPA: hypothetical protein [Caudoviricetes sp.]
MSVLIVVGLSLSQGLAADYPDGSQQFKGFI